MRYIKWYMVCGGLAQSVEQRNHNPSVAGSIPAPATTCFLTVLQKTVFFIPFFLRFLRRNVFFAFFRFCL